MNFILPQGSRVHINIDRTAGIRIDSERGARECFAVLFPAQSALCWEEKCPVGSAKKVGRGSYGAFHHPEITVTI